MAYYFAFSYAASIKGNGLAMAMAMAIGAALLSVHVPSSVYSILKQFYL